jgi:hypothetical protein
VLNKTREFEVKTIRQKYYTIAMKGGLVVLTTPIEQFSIPVELCYVRGAIDPMDGPRYIEYTKKSLLWMMVGGTSILPKAVSFCDFMGLFLSNR